MELLGNYSGKQSPGKVCQKRQPTSPPVDNTIKGHIENNFSIQRYIQGRISKNQFSAAKSGKHSLATFVKRAHSFHQAVLGLNEMSS